jgi:hypothetical protein
MSGKEPYGRDPKRELDRIDGDQSDYESYEGGSRGANRIAGHRSARGANILDEIEHSIAAYGSRIYFTRTASVFLAVLACAVGVLVNHWFLLIIPIAACLFWLLETSLKPVAWPFVLSRARSAEKIRLTEVTEHCPSVDEQVKELHVQLKSEQPEYAAKINAMLAAKHKTALYLGELLLGLVAFVGFPFLNQAATSIEPLKGADGPYAPGPSGTSALQVKLVVADGEPLRVPIALKIDSSTGVEPLSIPISLKTGVLEPIRVPLEVTSTRPEPVAIRLQTKLDETVAVKLPIHVQAETSSDAAKPLRVPIQIMPDSSPGDLKTLKIPIEVDVNAIVPSVVAPCPVDVTPRPYLGRYRPR